MRSPGSAAPVQRIKIGKSVAFVADICTGLPAEFASCDILYSEIAWERTFARFAERAGVPASYDSYITAVAQIAQNALGGKAPPVILICGKSALKHLPTPTARMDVNLNTGGPFIAVAVTVSFGAKLPRVTERHKNWTNVDTESLLRALAKKYDRVGDFSCGYGNTGLVFANAGKTFVMSDMNAECIGHIAHTMKMKTAA
jgi:hypothetical protein